jgi:hypothetical protein
MKRDDTIQILLNSISIFTNRDWGYPEKNNRAAELAHSIQKAVNLCNDVEMEKLVVEIQSFMSPSFVLFKRMESLIKRQEQRAWRTAQDNATWSGLIERASIIIQRRDNAELVEIAPRIITFLRRRNEHVLAQSLEEATNICKPQRR